MVDIYGTLGPACSSSGILSEMFAEGMTGIRLNLSHTSLKEAGDLLHEYTKAASAAGCSPDLLIDLQGPELRIGLMEQKLLEEGSEVIMEHDCSRASHSIPVPAFILKSLERGDHVLLDDGKLELEITKVPSPVQKTHSPVNARVIRGGVLKSRKSLKIVGKYVEAPVLTQMDRENIRSAREYGVTAVMQPFVKSGRDLRQLREALKEAGEEDLRIFAKIETMEGAENIADILPEADMIVIARGDLGNDMPLWKLPAVQKKLSKTCREAGKPFLVVTQMLASMVDNPVPTRAEVSDIFNAVLDGASAVMVTNETAAGKYPAEVMKYLRMTCAEAEKYLYNS